MTQAADTAPPAARPGLEHFPVPFFAVTMGLSGLVLALRAASLAMGWSLQVDGAGLILVGLVFGVTAATYGLKGRRYPAAVAAEWNHPVRLAFFPAITISILLLAAIAVPVSEPLARVLWSLGVVGQFGLTLAVISGWIGQRAFQQGVLSPAWFIPAVGNVVVPLSGVPLGFVEPSWYFLSVGLLFWLVLLTMVMNRLVFHDPLPARLQPTLVILIAPPAVGFVAWLRLNGGELDAMARILLNLAWFFAALVALQAPRLLRLPFALSFWALSFPVAAVTIATLTYGTMIGSRGVVLAGLALLAVLVVVIAGLIVRTVRGLLSGELLLPEG